MNPHFASLVMGLAAQAEATLQGQVPPGVEGVSSADLRQAAQAMIDTLGMLEEKTRGRLTKEEEHLLTEALTGLRFRFVQATGPSH